MMNLDDKALWQDSLLMISNDNKDTVQELPSTDSHCQLQTIVVTDYGTYPCTTIRRRDVFQEIQHIMMAVDPDELLLQLPPILLHTKYLDIHFEKLGSIVWKWR